MYKRVGIKKLGKKTSHRESMIQNQMRTLFSSGVLKTTTAKAKVVKGRSESLISDMKTKKVSLDTRRKLLRVLGNKELVEKSIKYSQGEKVGVRIRKLGYRAGDNGEVSKLELIGFETKKKKAKVEKKDAKKKVEEVKESTNKDIEEKTRRKSTSGKANKTQRKTTERARSRSGL
jgi:large subunit ribosomal protein L17